MAADAARPGRVTGVFAQTAGPACTRLLETGILLTICVPWLC
jgi:hypothetical protein